MRRIKATGCGYSLDPGRSYTCNGLPKLKSSFSTTNMDTATKTDWLSVIDNYNNVPQQIEGFIMTLTPILDMSGGSANNIEVPELDCRVNFDPFMDMPGSVLKTEDGYTSIEATQDTGFVDMFDNGPGIEPNTKYRDDVYVDVNGSTYNIFIGPAGPAFLPAFTTNGTSYIMRPGILEPMVDTTFTPISIDVNPPLFDGTNTAIAILNKWRVEVDKRFRDIYNKIRPWSYDDSNVKGHLGLQDALQKDTPCDNFRIMLTQGTPLEVLTESASEHSAAKYQVGGGSILIDNVPVDVLAATVSGGGVKEYTPPFTVFLDVHGGTADIIQADDGVDPTPGHTYVYIGEVREVTNAAEVNSENSLFSRGSTMSIYQIIQGDCIESVNTGGNGGPGEYMGPFKVKIDGTTTYLARGTTVTQELYDSINVTGKPEVGTVTSQDYTAYVYKIVDGANSIPSVGGIEYAGYVIEKGIHYVKGREKTFRVDASVTATAYVVGTKTDSTWAYDYRIVEGKEKPSADIDPESQTALDQYWVPIGCVSGGSIGQIQYGDIYIDLQDEIGPVPSYQYTGPFAIGDTGAVTCPDCPLELDGTTYTRPIGYYSINGEDTLAAIVGSTNHSAVTPSGASTGIYFTMDPDGWDISIDGCSAADCYEVYLGWIEGSTVTGSTETTFKAHQLHYGNIQIDGRWS